MCVVFSAKTAVCFAADWLQPVVLLISALWDFARTVGRHGSCESVNVDPASRENLVKCKTECLGGEMENNAVIRDLEISRRLQEFFAELPARKQ